jgi:hypothetical protein
MSPFASRQAWQLPVQWPDGAMASDARLVARDRLLKAAILFAMLTMTVLDRFGGGRWESPSCDACAGGRDGVGARR